MLAVSESEIVSLSSEKLLNTAEDGGARIRARMLHDAHDPVAFEGSEAGYPEDRTPTTYLPVVRYLVRTDENSVVGVGTTPDPYVVTALE